jgi:NAD(P)H-hydrate epimerase
MRDEPRFLVDAAAVRARLPVRAPGAHKGTFGKLLIVAGSVNYTGAPALSAEAAYRAGAGLVTVATPPDVASVVGAHLLEATYLLAPHDLGVIAADAAAMLSASIPRFDALLVGPGLGRERTTGSLIERLFQAGSDRSRRRAMGFQPNTATGDADSATPLPPTVVDADGLFLLASIDGWWRRLPPAVVLTPHPGEMARLTGLTIDAVEADRWGVAARHAALRNAVVALKGAHTVIAEPGGQLAVLPFKTPALAKAGTGDVLAGVIAGLLAQGVSAFDAALAGAYAHGLAGRWLGDERGARGVSASDVARVGIARALQMLEA